MCLIFLGVAFVLSVDKVDTHVLMASSLDLSTAFDVVNIELLLKRLKMKCPPLRHNRGAHNNVVKWQILCYASDVI